MMKRDPERDSQSRTHPATHRVAPCQSLLATLALIVVCPLAGCGDMTDANVTPVETGEAFLAVANVSFDFQTGTFGAVNLDGFAAFPDLTAIHSDSVLRASGGYLFVINRMGADNLQLLDPATFATVWQYSVGAGSNPHDVAVVAPNRAYVTLYETGVMAIVDPTASNGSEFNVGEIDFTAEADEDGIPELGNIVELGGVVYVAAQRLDRNAGFVPINTSRLLAIDSTTDEPIDLSPDDETTTGVDLPIANPVEVRSHDSQIWLACAGHVGELDGALLRFDPTSGQFSDPVVLEEDIGGDVAGFVPGDPIILVWNEPSLVRHVSAIDPDTGDEIARIADDLGYIHDIEADASFIYVPDRNQDHPGLRVFRRDDFTEISESPIETGLPPWSLEVVAF